MALYKLSSNHMPNPWGYEDWLLSCHPSAPSKVISPNNSSATPLFDKLKEENLYSGPEKFPLLVKILKADDKLSVQVHPDDKYIRSLHANSSKDKEHYGKSESWFILDAKEGSTIIWGWKKSISPEDFEKKAKEKTLEENLRTIPVKKGDFIYVPAGTVHAIGGGIKLLEIQQSSDTTYRIFDYERNRELHIDHAKSVSNLTDSPPMMFKDFQHSFCCPSFTVQKLTLNENEQHKIWSLKENNWLMIFAINEPITITEKEGKGEKLTLKKEEAALITKSADLTWNEALYLVERCKETKENGKSNNGKADYILSSQ